MLSEEILYQVPILRKININKFFPVLGKLCVKDKDLTPIYSIVAELPFK